MAAHISDGNLDAALTRIKTNVENLYICSQQPTTFLQASSTYKLGTKAAPSTGTIADGDVSGRKLPINAVTDGVVNTAGTATWKALCDDSVSELLVAQELNAPKAIVTGSPFTLTAWDVELPDPVA
jgi:hypothetical protein